MKGGVTARNDLMRRGGMGQWLVPIFVPVRDGELPLPRRVDRRAMPPAPGDQASDRSDVLPLSRRSLPGEGAGGDGNAVSLGNAP
jgi:hypothetical protein